MQSKLLIDKTICYKQNEKDALNKKRENVGRSFEVNA